MNRSRIAVGSLLLAAGLGIASGTPHPPAESLSATFGPVVKCQGVCLDGAAARAADTRLRTLADQYAANRTLVAERCIPASAPGEDWGLTRFLDPPLPLRNR